MRNKILNFKFVIVFNFTRERIINCNPFHTKLTRGKENNRTARMLHRLSVDVLKKTAIYGAFLTATGCSVLYYLIQSEF